MLQHMKTKISIDKKTKNLTTLSTLSFVFTILNKGTQIAHYPMNNNQLVPSGNQYFPMVCQLSTFISHFNQLLLTVYEN